MLLRVLDVRDAADQHRFAADVREWLTAPLAAVFNNAGVAVASSVIDPTLAMTRGCGRSTSTGSIMGRVPSCHPCRTGRGCPSHLDVFGPLGMPYQSAYCASKFAVRGFTDALRQELRGTGVSAVTVHPGGITTNIARNARVRRIGRPRA